MTDPVFIKDQAVTPVYTDGYALTLGKEYQVTLGSGNALGESSEHYRTQVKHLIIIAKPDNVVTAPDGTVTVDLGTKDEAIKALRYALERLEK